MLDQDVNQTITLGETNDFPPVAEDVNETVLEETPLRIRLAASDPNEDDPSNLEYEWTDIDPAEGTLTPTDISGLLHYLPERGFNGIVQFTYQATDNTGLTSNVANVTVEVVGENDPPIAHMQRLSTPEDTPLPITLDVTDPDNDALTYRIVDQPANGTIAVIHYPDIVYRPEENFSGNDSFSFMATDAHDADTAVAWIHVEVTAVNDPPHLALSGVWRTKERQNISIHVQASDPDNENLTYQLLSGPRGATINANSGWFNWTPGPGAAARSPYRVMFRVSDGELTDDDTINIEVTPGQNSRPRIWVSSRSSVKEGRRLRLWVRGTDADGDALRYSVDCDPAIPRGDITFRRRNARWWYFSWRTRPGQARPQRYRIKFTVSDGEESAIRTKMIKVTE